MAQYGTGRRRYWAIGLVLALVVAVVACAILLRCAVGQRWVPVRVIQAHGPDMMIHAIVFSPDMKQIAGGVDGYVRVWHVDDGTLLWERRFNSTVRSVAYSLQGDRIVACVGESGVFVLDSNTGDVSCRFNGYEGSASGASFLACGDRIASVSGYEHVVRVWDSRTGVQLQTTEEVDSLMYGVAASPTEPDIIALAASQLVASYDLASDRFVWRVGGPPYDYDIGTSSLRFAPEGKTLVSAGLEGVMLWDAATGENLGCLRGHTDLPLSACYPGVGTVLLTTGWDGRAILWDTQEQRAKCKIDAFLYAAEPEWPGLRTCVGAISADCRLIATSAAWGRVVPWRSGDTEERQSGPGDIHQ